MAVNVAKRFGSHVCFALFPALMAFYRVIRVIELLLDASLHGDKDPVIQDVNEFGFLVILLRKLEDLITVHLVMFICLVAVSPYKSAFRIPVVIDRLCDVFDYGSLFHGIQEENAVFAIRNDREQQLFLL